MIAHLSRFHFLLARDSRIWVRLLWKFTCKMLKCRKTYHEKINENNEIFKYSRLGTLDWPETGHSLSVFLNAKERTQQKPQAKACASGAPRASLSRSILVLLFCAFNDLRKRGLWKTRSDSDICVHWEKTTATVAAVLGWRYRSIERFDTAARLHPLEGLLHSRAIRQF